MTKRVASFLLPIGFGLGDFVAAAKAAFVEAGAEQISSRGDRPSTARISAVTGLSRAEVAKIRANGLSAQRFTEPRTARVMHGWFTDARFIDLKGNPRALNMTGLNSFDELVRNYSGDLPRRALLEELRAGGMVEVNEKGEVTPLRRHYLVDSSRSAEDLKRIAADSEIFLCSAAKLSKDDSSALRRVTVQFPNGVPLSVRRTVALRTERFLEGLADYLNASATSTRRLRRSAESSGRVLHLIVAQAEIERSDEGEGTVKKDGSENEA